MHLKNFSLLTGEDGVIRLTPGYNLVSTHLVIPDDPLALPVGGKNTQLTRNDWLRFAERGNLPRKAAQRLLAEQIEATEPAVNLVGRSFLPPEQKEAYEELLRARTARLRGGQ